MKNTINYIWQDRKRFMGMPLSFTKYKLAEDRLFVETGLFSTKYEEVVLYRIRDISLSRNLWQKLFGVGTVTVQSSDASLPTLVIKNVKKSFDVKELIHKSVEDMKIARRARVNEVIGDIEDEDGDGIPDILDEE
ncbi:MAG: PH domain-containing protein [Clostridia bacterium]|nr:PH domain-containing protein [Clostridia bacterium]